MKELLLSQGKIAIVDDHDFALANQYKWSAKQCGTNWYATTRDKETKVPMLLHRYLLQFPVGIIDHIDGNGLNNSRINLRITSSSINTQKGIPSKRNHLGLRGIFWAANCCKWRASITVLGERINLGLFRDINEAVTAYNKAARLNFDTFCFQNESLICVEQDRLIDAYLATKSK